MISATIRSVIGTAVGREGPRRACLAGLILGALVFSACGPERAASGDSVAQESTTAEDAAATTRAARIATDSACVSDAGREAVRNAIESQEASESVRASASPQPDPGPLATFYERRHFALVWCADPAANAQAEVLAAALEAAGDDGLRPDEYQPDAIRAALTPYREGRAMSVAELAARDLLLTDAFLRFGTHLLVGRVDPQLVHSLWRATLRDRDRVAEAAQALSERGVLAVLDDLRPPHAGYARLRVALQHYRALATPEDWVPFPETLSLGLGDSAGTVALLRDRLVRLGDLPHSDSSTARFDSTLANAIGRFQARHGLRVDGRLGVPTIAELNVPPSERAHQIEVNLERWRWLPQDLGERHVRVNIAGFTLEVVEADTVVAVHRVVVGRDYRRTPTFSDQITHLVLNPSWNVPRRIATTDLLPLIRKDRDYLTQRRFRVFRGEREIPATEVQWDQLDSTRFPYSLRQDPGPSNAMGQVKFMFPNAYQVYLHDTPDRELFDESSRGFSSGCIRVERALALAERLYLGNPHAAAGDLHRWIDERRERTISLTRPVPVHLLYWTAWVDEDGITHFGRDVYDRDTELDRALHTP